MGTQWEPKKIDHTALRAQRAGIVGPFMVFGSLLVVVLVFAVVMYVFTGLHLEGQDFIQILMTLNEAPKRFAALKEAFSFTALWPFIMKAFVPGIVFSGASYVLFALRKAKRASGF